MDARRAVGAALKCGDAAGLAVARAAVDEAKIALGERGPVWWTDGAPDFNRHTARTTPYATWYRLLAKVTSAPIDASIRSMSPSPISNKPKRNL